MAKSKVDADFVRLSESFRRQMIADVAGGSLWSISGHDVKPVPDEDTNPLAYAYVRDMMRAGVLEGASQAEADIIEDSNDKLSAAVNTPDGVQAQNAQVIIDQQQAALEAARKADEEQAKADAEAAKSTKAANKDKANPGSQ